jgi:hypothetical protein
MTGAIISNAQPDYWDDVWNSDPSATPFQSRAWMEAAVATGHYADISRAYTFGQGRVVVPLAAVRQHFKGKRGMSMPHGMGAGGFIADFEPGPTEIGTILNDLRSLNLRGVAIRPNPIRSACWDVAHQAGWSRVGRSSHVLDLDGGYDAVWARMHSPKRNRIRKARASGLVLERGNDPVLVGRFYALYLRWSAIRAQRRRLPPALITLLARWREPRWKFDATARRMGPALTVLMASHEGREVAGAVYLQMGKSAVYWRGASDLDLSREYPANDLLQDEMIAEACNAGCTHYHMGESGGVESLMRFKSQFGAQPIDYSEWVIAR